MCVIDCTHVLIQRPLENDEAYMNKTDKSSCRSPLNNEGKAGVEWMSINILAVYARSIYNECVFRQSSASHQLDMEASVENK